MIENFHFLRPYFLFLLPVGVILSWMVYNWTSSKTGWEKICDPHLLAQQLSNPGITLSKSPYLLVLGAWVLATLAAAGPAWQEKPQIMTENLRARVIAFDVSLSMYSTDVSPTRLERARYKLTDLIHQGTGMPQGLVVFAGDAFVVVPVTDDIDTLINLVPSLDSRTVPVQGSRADLAISTAAELLAGSGFNSGEIILITDGSSSDAATVASDAAAKGFSISVLGIGTQDGEPVRLKDGKLLKDSAGNIVIPGVDHQRLREIAAAGFGRYARLTSDSEDINRVGSSIDFSGQFSDALRLSQEDKLWKKEYRTDRWHDNGPWLLLPVLVLCALGFRRGWILLIFLAITPVIPNPVMAFEWSDLWRRSDQQAANLFKEEQYEKLPQDSPPTWQGAAYYRTEDFTAAAAAFSQAYPEDSMAQYNLGNALAKSGKFDLAIATYQKALELNPDNSDAGYNQELIKSLLEQQQQSSQQTSGKQQGQPNNSEEMDKKKEEDTFQEGMEDEQITTHSPNNQDTGQAPDEQALSESKLPDKENGNSNETDGAKGAKDQIDAESVTMAEQEQVLEKWLKRIESDPGGLLRRKFSKQYSQRKPVRNSQSW